MTPIPVYKTVAAWRASSSISEFICYLVEGYQIDRSNATDQQMRFAPTWMALRECAAECATLRARVAKLEEALKEIEFHGGPAADFARAALSETVEA